MPDQIRSKMQSKGLLCATYLPSVSHAAPVCGLVLALFYYWFAIADRYAIFLYYHDMGPLFPDTSPFSAETSGRYWMAGLVAAGLVMAAYVGANWLLGRIATTYRPPAWWRVWLWCAPPLAIGIPAITMTVNRPTLPPVLAAACVAATLAGLALALLPGAWAARRPSDLAWLLADGVGLLPALELLRAIELPGRGVNLSAPVAYSLAIGGTLAGVIGLGVMTALRAWRHKPGPGAGELLAAALGLNYLLLPVAHYLFAAPPQYRYISSSSNFFAYNGGVQLAAWGVAAGLAVGITRLRQLLGNMYDAGQASQSGR